MTPAQSYRANAQAQRQAAANTSLPSRRDMHERSAVAWEEKARAAEETAAMASANATAKANGVPQQPVFRDGNGLRRV